MISRIRSLILTAALALAILVTLTGCYRPMNLEKAPIPPKTLVLEFSIPLRYVIDLKIDGQTVPIRYVRKNRRLWIEGLPEGTHNINIHSISYVFGPEWESFTFDGNTGQYFFIQARRYRSTIPKDRALVSIRAYRRKLKEEGVNVEEKTAGKIRASFKH